MLNEEEGRELTPQEISDQVWILKELVDPLMHGDGGYDKALLDSFHKLAQHENPSRISMQMMVLIGAVMQIISIDNHDIWPCGYLHTVIATYEETLHELN